MSIDLDSLVRENIRRLKPYSSARSEFTGSAEVFLDANENAFGSPAGNGYNRYPDPLQKELKAIVTELDTEAAFYFIQLFTAKVWPDSLAGKRNCFQKEGRKEKVERATCCNHCGMQL